MTPDQAAQFAARITAAIDADLWNTESVRTADRERVASDLSGLRRHSNFDGWCLALCQGDPTRWPCPDARRYADGLRRTGALYRVEERRRQDCRLPACGCDGWAHP